MVDHRHIIQIDEGILLRACTLQPCKSSALNYKDIRVTSFFSFCVSVTQIVIRSSLLPGSAFRMDRVNLLRLSTPRVFLLQPELFAVSKSSSREWSVLHVNVKL